ncbi:hypothetical protein DIE15_17590 [Burkholderia sp. Bp9031]|uniref:ESPR-type extended signal peptide-containing protein n=1 Tax=Burkholderia sp. Bp9031 TaxID=2184566 RepID=UPI0007165BB9|nr:MULTISPECIES: ESPR-type extended signal peptide-containing protein [Burkholderia]RQZ14790.1 hypothetical protein DIE15_17590 [Burkholderia sp. Bp9031]
MNKTSATAWNQAQGCWSAVRETARRRTKPGSAKRIATALSLLGFTALPAFALPTNGNVTAGNADIFREDDNRIRASTLSSRLHLVSVIRSSLIPRSA